ncbi:MAG TPA: ATP-binding protein, partial [Nitrospiraceae bacterium]
TIPGAQTRFWLHPRPDSAKINVVPGVDFSKVRNHESVKRALEITAAGGHHALVVGPSHADFSMFPNMLLSIIPLAKEGGATRIPSLVSACPTGSGPQLLAEANIGHHGVLFLDDLSKFKRSALEPLCTRLTEGSKFILVASFTGCPCGRYGTKDCRCSPLQIQRHQARVIGPLLDSADIHIDVPASSRSNGESSIECSDDVRAKVDVARAVQRGRAGKLNARLRPEELRIHCKLDADKNDWLKMVVNELGIAERAHNPILRVARTVGDLDASIGIETRHLAEAIQYRVLDRQLSG